MTNDSRFALHTISELCNRFQTGKHIYCISGSIFYLVLFFFLNDIFIRICEELSPCVKKSIKYIEINNPTS